MNNCHVSESAVTASTSNNGEELLVPALLTHTSYWCLPYQLTRVTNAYLTGVKGVGLSHSIGIFPYRVENRDSIALGQEKTQCYIEFCSLGLNLGRDFTFTAQVGMFCVF